MDHYNKQKIRTSLDMARCEVPLEAFRRKMASKKVREANTHWMEEDGNE